MKVTEITSCHIGPEISPEQFVQEHVFLYLAVGMIEGYDGNKRYAMKAGDYCVVKKNHLARYSKQQDQGRFEKVAVIFDGPFLKDFKRKYAIADAVSNSKDAFVMLEKNKMILNFVNSLAPYYNESGKIDETFSNVKREELLLILLQISPKLRNVFFDFGIPEKIDLEAFMHRNYKFNVSLERLAYLTGRSLSAFKRDFQKIFHSTPGHWLIQKRLREAHFQIEKEGKRPSDIYLDLGFEDLSHFSFAFKKLFGYAPRDAAEHKKRILML